MTTRRSVRPGSKIWKRVDGQWTGVKTQMSGAGYLENFPGATAEEKLASEMKQPGATWIFDGNPSDNGGGGFEIEDYSRESVLKDAIVVLAPSKPPFGQWVELDEWPSDGE